MNYSNIISKAAFDAIVEQFISDHSEKKREKVLITQTMYDEAIEVLKRPKSDTTISTPRHRFWVHNQYLKTYYSITRQIVLTPNNFNRFVNILNSAKTLVPRANTFCLRNRLKTRQRLYPSVQKKSSMTCCLKPILP